MTRSTIVIGAGLAGLSAAIHLAAAGRDVTLLEAGDSPGGCCGTASVNGYRFDTGPSVLTAPEVIEETVGAPGEDLSGWLPLAELDPYYRLTFHDGSHLDVLPGAERMADEASRLAGPREASRYLAFRDHLQRMHRAEWGPFIADGHTGLAELARPATLVSLARLARLGALRRMSALVARHLSDWRLIRAHTFQALYVGLDPHRAPASPWSPSHSWPGSSTPTSCAPESAGDDHRRRRTSRPPYGSPRPPRPARAATIRHLQWPPAGADMPGIAVSRLRHAPFR